MFCHRRLLKGLVEDVLMECNMAHEAIWVCDLESIIDKKLESHKGVEKVGIGDDKAGNNEAKEEVDGEVSEEV